MRSLGFTEEDINDELGKNSQSQRESEELAARPSQEGCTGRNGNGQKDAKARQRDGEEGFDLARHPYKYIKVAADAGQELTYNKRSRRTGVVLACLPVSDAYVGYTDFSLVERQKICRRLREPLWRLEDEEQGVPPAKLFFDIGVTIREVTPATLEATGRTPGKSVSA